MEEAERYRHMHRAMALIAGGSLAGTIRAWQEAYGGRTTTIFIACGPINLMI